ncbi:TetR family transcriptional regulator [Deminuibacter soli]|uniref:TetR/AcrR family transcriptional regulator n=1 Tax=Deminuibacter soli TaxID=2291815 RepID=A0A3E1NLV2_9BACT|nr:TetR family transcriptional regulator [Deminuibacter soli]RFM28897.1 TetR/AcrR family transcriptional regulator [Deminuibacter soli]
MGTDKKEHIINTAIELFAVKGFEGTSIRDLAAAAGVNIAMINYYFGSKEKLFESMVEEKAAYTRIELTEIMSNTSLNAAGKIDRIVEGFVERLFRNRHFHRVIHQELMLGDRQAMQDMIVNILYPNSQLIKQILLDGIASGEFNKVDVELTVATLIGTINYLLQSKKFCLKILDETETYVPYEDEEFKTRVKTHLKAVLHIHLVHQPK